MKVSYPQEFVNEILEKTDLVDLISEYMSLKKTGNTYSGLCPFHNEKTPSFHVSREKGLFHCFGCGSAGNSINYIMKIENINYTDAIITLAQRASIPLPHNEISESERKSNQLMEEIIRINREAAKYYVNNLAKSGAEAFNYLQNRGLDIETIKRFGLGFAPNDWQTMKNYLRVKGFSEEGIIKSGLIVPDKTGKNYYDRFRNRIIFPIINTRNQVIGFGGRVMDSSFPKYLNSPDTPVFTKGNNLYNINLAKGNIKDGKLIVVEGYMDVIALYQLGVQNVVATLGTALTSNQAKLIKRYSEQVFVVYDSDAAGQSATIKGMDILKQQGCMTKIVRLPEGYDPDEYIRTYGKDNFTKTLENSMGVIEYKIHLSYGNHDLSTPEGKGNFIKEIKEILKGVNNRVEKEAYVKQIIDKTDISLEAIYAELGLDKASNQMNSQGRNRYISQTPKDVVLKPAHITGEANLLSLIIKDKNVYNIVIQTFNWNDYIHPVHRELARIVYNYYQQSKEIKERELIASFYNPEDAQRVTEIINNNVNYDNRDKAVQDFIVNINKYKNELEIEKIKKEIGELMVRNNLSESEKQLVEQLNQKMKKLLTSQSSLHSS